MTTILWVVVLAGASVACLVAGVLVGVASVYVHLQQRHPGAWRVLQADNAEERALKRFAARRTTRTSTAREW